MNTTSAVVLAAAIAVTGRWAKGDKKVPMSVIVGIAGAAIFLSIMSEVNEKLGQQFALLLVVSAALIYAVPIAKWIGWSK